MACESCFRILYYNPPLKSKISPASPLPLCGSRKNPSSSALLPSERISYPNCFFGNQVAAKLGQIVDVIDVELGPNEHVVRHVDLNSHAAVHLKMVGALKILAEILAADHGTGRAALIKLKIRAADSAPSFRALRLYGLVDAV